MPDHGSITFFDIFGGVGLRAVMVLLFLKNPWIFKSVDSSFLQGRSEWHEESSY